MQCTHENQYYRNGQFNPNQFPCGKCLSCKLNKRHEWAARLILERKCHTNAQFITLTYDDDHLPHTPEDVKRSFQLWTKRFRKNTQMPLRYFACMEYGTKFGRAHWHAILFGRSTNVIQRSAKRSLSRTQVWVDPQIEDTWQNGSTYVKACNASTQAMNITQYIAAYILKDTWKHSGSESDSSKSERALMSRKPYIGHPAVKSLSDALTTKAGARHCGILGTVPDTFTFAKRQYRIPPRIRKEVADSLGYPLLPVPHSDGTITTIDGLEVRNEIYVPKKTYKEATAHENRIRSKIRRSKTRNLTTATG